MAKKSKRRSVTRSNGLANFNLKRITPLTANQKIAFKDWAENKHLVLHGSAGTGKTFIALYLALSTITDSSSEQDRICIIRSTVPARNQGFIPGKPHEKEAPYEEPYQPMFAQLFDRGDAYQIVKIKQDVEFRSTSWLRGLTLDNAVIIVDEFQNASDSEINTIMTRIGINSRVIFCGDIKQDDLTSKRYSEKSGAGTFIRVAKRMDDFSTIEFTANDIVRSDFVKNYIMVREELGL